MYTHHKKKILIAGFSDKTTPYHQALTENQFHVLYPKEKNTLHFYTLCALSELEFDLLLLPGGGDITPELYTDDLSEAYAMTGAPDPLTDLLQFQLLMLAFLKKKPILGICKGMQMINVFFGGTLFPHISSADIHAFHGTDRYHKVAFDPNFTNKTILWNSPKAAGKLLEILNPYSIVNSAHHQAVKKPGENLTCIQLAPDATIEAIAHKHLPILGLQWHPERLSEFRKNSFKNLIELLLQF